MIFFGLSRERMRMMERRSVVPRTIESSITTRLSVGFTEP